MPVSRFDSARRCRLIAYWLRLVAALVFAMVVVGGATRLTESGLSIVEWQPVEGTVPPLAAAAWQAEFAKYQTIPQYQRLNRGMTLEEFKTIYWWEWSHRLLGRLTGVAFLLPFLWFLWRGWVDRRLAVAFGGLFGLGALQGAVGWWMVASGLTERVSVSQYRLAFHLTLACLIYAALLWAAERIIAPARAASPARENAFSLREMKDQKKEPRRIRLAAGVLLALAIIQIYLGALVAGLRAGLVYNTWPLIDGSLVPRAADLLFIRPAWRNFFENALTAQFDHRMMAYALLALALFHAADAYRHGKDKPLTARAGLLALAVIVQAGLGVLTLLRSAPIDLALMHQATALLVLTLAAIHACRTSMRPQPAAAVTSSETPFLSPAYGGEKAQAAFSSRE